jgi:hypothetical protein
MRTHQVMQAAQALNPISLEALRAKAPAIFSERPAPSVSKEYEFIPTIRVLDRLVNQHGFSIVQVSQERSKDAENMGFQRHMIKLTRADLRIGDDIAQVIISNAHDATSAFRIMGGVFRFACHNGLVVGSFAMNQVIRHVDIEEGAIDAVYRIVDDVPKIAHDIKLMQNTIINDEQAWNLASKAAELRWGKEAPEKIDPMDLLRIHRKEDTGLDLWSHFNVVQENTIGGGFKMIKKMKNGAANTVRKLETVGENLSVNEKLWNAAFAMVK